MDEGGIIQGVILFVAAVQSMHKVFINVACRHERAHLSLPRPSRFSPRARARALFRFLSRSQHAADNG